MSETATEPVQLRGLILRYVLTHYLQRAGALTVAELVTRLGADGFAVQGRASKVISDTLRWEIRRGRVVRVGRSAYVAGFMPRGTANLIQRRYQAALQGHPWPARRI